MLAKRLQNLADEIKDKLTDQQYLELCDVSQAVHYLVSRDDDRALLYATRGLQLLAEQKYSTATREYEKAIDLYSIYHGPKYIGLVPLYTNMGNSLSRQGLYNDALEMYERSLHINLDHNFFEHIWTGQIYNNIAAELCRQRRFAEAQGYLERGLNILSAHEHPGTMELRRNIAQMYFDTERYEEARNEFERAAECSERALGRDHPDTQYLLRRVAECSERSK